MGVQNVAKYIKKDFMSLEMKHHVFFEGTFMQHLQKTDFQSFPLSQEKNAFSLLKSGQLFLAFFAETWLHMHALKDWRVVLPVEIPNTTELVRYEESESPYTSIGCPVTNILISFFPPCFNDDFRISPFVTTPLETSRCQRLDTSTWRSPKC